MNNFSGVRQLTKEKYNIPVKNGDSLIELDDYEPTLCMNVESNTPVQLLIVCMDSAVLTKLTGQCRNDLTNVLDRMQGSSSKGNGHEQRQDLFFAQRLCGYQTLTSFMTEPHDTLFLEAKALELVALQLKQLDFMTEKAPQPPPVDHYLEKITYACEILKKEMADPPKIMELARRVNLNHNHLIQGFKNILNMSPYQYLRVIRLEKAYDMIVSHKSNVTEAAFYVGYSSLSHFTKTFRQQFGTNPKTLAKEKKQKALSKKNLNYKHRI